MDGFGDIFSNLLSESGGEISTERAGAGGGGGGGGGGGAKVSSSMWHPPYTYWGCRCLDGKIAESE